MPPRRRSSRVDPRGLTWREAPLAPVVLVHGAETLLAERAVDRVLLAARREDPEVEVVRLDATAYVNGELTVATSPSLFAEAKAVVLSGLEAGTDAALTDAQTYLSAPIRGVVVVLRHGGGQRGRRLLEVLSAADVPTVTCDPVRTDAEKSDFVSAELRDAGRRADPRAIQALVEAVGGDLRELAASCAQLLSDSTGLITAEVVDRYYGGRIEATGFQVADAAVAADAGRAIALLRHAMDTGVDPVPMVGALALKLRTLAKVAALRGRGHTAARDLGLAPWQVDRASHVLRHWTPEGLAVAITAVAEADAEVKGEARDRRYAVERAVLRVAQAAAR